jgi:hypothetical protein
MITDADPKPHKTESEDYKIEGIIMLKKTAHSVIYAAILLFPTLYVNCASHSFNVTKNTLFNGYLMKAGVNDERWGIFFVTDEDQMKEFRAEYEKNVSPEQKKQPGHGAADSLEFRKYQYLVFYMPSDTEPKPIGNRFSFSMKDAKGNPVNITDTLFFINRGGFDENVFEYSWMIRFDKPLIPEFFPEQNRPLEFTASDGPYTSAKIEIAF